MASDFRTLSQLTQSKFKSKSLIQNQFTYAGVYFSVKSGSLTINQPRAALRLETISTACTFREFNSRLMELGWLVQTRPQIAYHVDMLSQGTEPIFRSEGPISVRRLNNIIGAIRQNPERGLRQINLYIYTLHLRIYSDRSVANNRDLTSQLGYIIFASDVRDYCSSLPTDRTRAEGSYAPSSVPKHVHSLTRSIRHSRRS